ncbi:hypothetical protein [uncultured Metabacillus sp.]|uniref:hypothetical protein n=1 Tax=uncultured Metabacillus sp. TaxID=2860135 RepID=UPI002620D16E|nr:hypothetical protein [uncultured Metabacillus sp.]
MIRIIYLCIFSFLFVAVSSNSAAAISLDEAKDIQKKVNNLNEQVLNDIQTSFNFKPSNNFNKMSNLELALLAKNDSSLFDILEMSIDLCEKGCIGSSSIYHNEENG